MHRKLISLAALAVAIAAIAGVGYAAIPGSNGVISACKDSKGALKVIDAEAGQTCNANQQPLSWNQEGPAGPQGAPGLSGREVVQAESGFSSTSTKSQHAFCPAGKMSIGGGAFVTNLDGNIRDEAALSRSMPGGTPSGWGASAFEPVETAASWKLVVYAVCASVQ